MNHRAGVEGKSQGLAAERFAAVLRAATEYSIVGTDRTGTITVFSGGAERMLGYRADEMVGKLTPLAIHDPAEVAARAAELGLESGFEVFVANARRGEAETREWTYVRKDGGRLRVSLTVSAMHEDGELTGFIGIARDITEEKRAEDEVRLLQTVLLAIGEAEDLTAALSIVLREVCQATGWSFGQAWVPSADGSTLECSEAWCGAAPGLALFREASRALAIRRDYGLAGHVYAQKRPIWERDLHREEGFIRAEAARAVGLRSGLAVPVLAGDAVVAVLEFFLFRPREEDERLVRTVSAVAAQLGAVIQRKRAEAEQARLVRELEAAEARFRGLLESAPDAVVITDGTGRIALVNRQTEKLFCYRREELLGQPVELLLPERFAAAHVARRGQYADHPRTRPMGIGLELTALRKDGSEFPVEISLSPMRSDEELLVTSIIRDVTEKRELERQKDEFFANVSHDLRTPLTAIKASLGVVLANEPSDMPEPLHRMLVNADLGADRLTKLVGDLLELTRLQAGRVQLRPERCDLRNVALRSAQAVEPLAQERQQCLSLELPPDPVVGFVDPERLERALVNLLGNAQKYGYQGGAIRLSLARRGGEARFAVADDGPGIPLAQQERIFERFYRPESEAASGNQGSGLGLPIARAMAELHGGHLWVESQPGAGATFWLTLPLVEVINEGESET